MGNERINGYEKERNIGDRRWRTDDGFEVKKEVITDEGKGYQGGVGNQNQAGIQSDRRSEGSKYSDREKIKKEGKKRGMGERVRVIGVGD